MLGEYFTNLENKVNNISHLMKKNDDLTHHLGIDRRDIDDLHTILMLRDAAKKIPKKNRLVFIGTGQINENVVHAYLHFQQAIKSNQITFEGDSLFIARSELEYKLITAFGFPCKRWQYQISLAQYLLEAKAVVLSSHLYSNWGDCLLSHCVSEAIKIELWHGLPAKSIGIDCINDKMDFHFFARLLNDCVSRNHICIQNDKRDVQEAYLAAFPYAKQHITGDARTDILFNEEFRQEFLNNKEDRTIKTWLNNNIEKFKLLYCPTYRETAEAIEYHYQKIVSMLHSIDSSKVVIAIKLHVGICLSEFQKRELEDICNEKGFLFIASYDEVYSTFCDFDGMIVDYSSIRSDFALTGKPIFLWRFDQNTYNRDTDVVNTFAKLDDICYELDDEIDSNIILKHLTEDSLREERESLITKELREFSDGFAAKRTIQVCLDIMKL